MQHQSAWAHHGLRLAGTRTGVGSGKAATGFAVGRLKLWAPDSEPASTTDVSTTSNRDAAREGVSQATCSSCSCDAEAAGGSIMSGILHVPGSTSSGMPAPTLATNTVAGQNAVSIISA